MWVVLGLEEGQVRDERCGDDGEQDIAASSVAVSSKLPVRKRRLFLLAGGCS